MIGGQHHVLGPAIGHAGSTATVHHLVGHPGVVAKVFHPGGAPGDQRRERENLDQVHEYYGHGDVNGHHIILAKKHTGHTLPNTQAWQNANAAERVRLKNHAMALTRDRNEQHAIHHGIVHT